IAFARARLQQARARAFAPTELQISATPALARQLVVLVEPELELPQRKHELRERSLADATELVLRVDEMVARVDATVVLERDVLAANGALRAKVRGAPGELVEHALEQIHFDAPAIVLEPFVENGRQERAPIVGIDAPFGHDG